MALEGTFTANFSSFYEATDKAVAKLRDFGDGADKVGQRLDRLSNQFSGRAIVQEATVMAKAVEEIGGVSKLTEKELARLGATTNEAVSKMRLLGMDVPKNLQAIADQTKNAGKATTDWLGLLSKAAGAVGLAFSVGAITNFIGSVFDAAGAVKDLSDAWGVSTTAVQGWTYAAKASGVEAETVGKSLQFMTDKLSEGSKEYDALLANVGLSGAKLRAMPFEDAAREIYKAIEGIEDKTLQFDVALGLIGPSAKKMVGAFRDGFSELAAAHKGWSDAEVKQLEAAGQAWEDLWNHVTLWSGTAMATALENSQRILSSWGNVFGTLNAAVKDWATGGWAKGSESATAQFLAQAKAGDQAADAMAGLAASMKPVSSHGAEVARTVETTAQVLARQKREEDAAKAATEARTKALAASKKDQEAYTSAVAAYEKSIRDLGVTLSGGGVIQKANDYLDAIKQSIPVQDMTRKAQEEINKVMVAAIEVYEAAGREVPAAIREMASATEAIVPVMITKRDQIMDVWKGFKLPLDLGAQISLDPAPPKPGIFDGFAKGLGGAMSSSILKAIQGGGSVLQAAGGAIGNFILDPKASGVGKSIEKAASKLPGLIGGAISSAIPIVGGLIGPAVGFLANKLSGWFGKSEAEKLRDSFVKSAGGIDVLRESAERAGVSVDKLFAGKKTDQVQASIAELEAAFRFQETALDAAMEAAKRYGFSIEELGPAMQRQELDKQAQQLFKDWEVLNAAGLDTVVITEKMSKAVSDYVNDAIDMGLEVPEAMRPMLEKFAKAGQLIDEDGNKIEDLEGTGIDFSMTMSEGFERLIKEVKNLTDAISRGLSPAIEDVPDIEVDRVVTTTYNERRPDMRPVPGAPVGANGLPEFAEGTGGFKNFGKGTPVMLHGWEAVVPRGDAASMATVTGAGGGGAPAVAGVVVNVNAQGAFFDTPESLQRLAGKVSDALTAKYSVMGKLRAAV